MNCELVRQIVGAYLNPKNSEFESHLKWGEDFIYLFTLVIVLKVR